MFTRFENGTYTYYTSLEFDRFIRTTKTVQHDMSNKYNMPLWLFCSNIVGSDFVSGYHYNASTHRLPSECLNYGNIHRSGLFNMDIDDLSDDEICTLKDLCKIDNNIKYCAKINSKALKGKKKALFLDKTQKKQALQRAHRLLILAGGGI